MPAGAPRITVIFLLYNASRTVHALVDAVSHQIHPEHDRQEEWLEVIFMDDRSRDGTLGLLREALSRLGNPPHYKIVPNEQNLGLSRTLNKAFQMAQAPLALSCHCDCFFGRPDYVAEMARLMEQNPKAAAITGQPIVPTPDRLPMAEKVNLVANLQDIFPADSTLDLVPVGFAEGRCDIFRIEALARVGYYETTLRLAGEDQVLAARLRAQGYEIYQAPKATYTLSVSDEQNTLGKLVKHQQLYGRAHPFIVLKTRGTSKGLSGTTAGANRSARTLLRLSQLFSTGIYAFSLPAALLGAPLAVWGIPLVAVLLLKAILFTRHLRVVHMHAKEFLTFAALQPAMDLAYTYGLLQGLWWLARGTESKPIS